RGTAVDEIATLGPGARSSIETTSPHDDSVLRGRGQGSVFARETADTVDLQRFGKVILGVGRAPIGVAAEHIIAAEGDEAYAVVVARAGEITHGHAVDEERLHRLLLAERHVVERRAVDHELGMEMSDHGADFRRTREIELVPGRCDDLVALAVAQEVAAELAGTTDEQDAHC